MGELSELLESIVGDYQGNPSILEVLSHFKRGEIDEAMVLSARILQDDENSVRAYNMLARSLTQQNRKQEAIRVLKLSCPHLIRNEHFVTLCGNFADVYMHTDEERYDHYIHVMKLIESNNRSELLNELDTEAKGATVRAICYSQIGEYNYAVSLLHELDESTHIRKACKYYGLAHAYTLKAFRDNDHDDIDRALVYIKDSLDLVQTGKQLCLFGGILFNMKALSLGRLPSDVEEQIRTAYNSAANLDPLLKSYCNGRIRALEDFLTTDV